MFCFYIMIYNDIKYKCYVLIYYVLSLYIFFLYLDLLNFLLLWVGYFKNLLVVENVIWEKSMFVNFM